MYSCTWDSLYTMKITCTSNRPLSTPKKKLNNLVINQVFLYFSPTLYIYIIISDKELSKCQY